MKTKNSNSPRNAYPFPNYANSPNMTAQAWPGYIRKKEAECGNKISIEEARKIFRILQGLSRSAKKEYREAKDAGCGSDTLKKIRKQEFILYDRKTKLWRGRVTPPKRESIGLERIGVRGEQSMDSLRSRHGNHPPQDRHSLLKTIQVTEESAGYPCDADRAVSILNTGKKSEFLEYHSETLTWRGFLQPEPSEEFSRVRKLELSNKQDAYWRMFADMPELAHDWRNPEQSLVVLWVKERNPEMSVDDVVRAYKTSWNCSENKLKVPLRRNPKNRNVYGINVWLRESFQDMPMVSKDSGDDDSNLNLWLAENIGPENPLGYLEVAIMAGHVIELSPGCFVGSETEIKRQQAERESEIRKQQARRDAEILARVRIEEKRYIERQEERARQAQLAEERERREHIAAKWIEKLKNPDSADAVKVRSMPTMRMDNLEGIDWINHNLEINDLDVAGIVYWRIKDLEGSGINLILFDRDTGTSKGADFARAEAEKKAEEDRLRAEEEEKRRPCDLQLARLRPIRDEVLFSLKKMPKFTGENSGNDARDWISERWLIPGEAREVSELILQEARKEKVIAAITGYRKEYDPETGADVDVCCLLGFAGAESV